MTFLLTVIAETIRPAGLDPEATGIIFEEDEA
jgi:hypothetical protein